MEKLKIHWHYRQPALALVQIWGLFAIWFACMVIAFPLFFCACPFLMLAERLDRWSKPIACTRYLIEQMKLKEQYDAELAANSNK